MAEYIERERLLRDPYFREDRYPESHLLRMAIMNQPAADVAPVVHGRWIAVKDFGGGHCVGYCDKCRMIHKASSPTALKLEYRFCRWCGARMDGE